MSLESWALFAVPLALLIYGGCTLTLYLNARREAKQDGPRDLEREP